MNELTSQGDALVHYKKVPLLARLTEGKTVIMWMFFVVAIMLLGSVFGAFAGPFIFHTIGMGFVFPVCYLGGIGVGIGAVFLVRSADRKLFGAMKAGISAMEDRFIEGSPMTREDLEKLVAGSLKLKRMSAADIYSKRLLALSMLPPDADGTIPTVPKKADWIVTTECWAATEKYHKGLNYKLVWLYETRGVLTLSPDSLGFESKKFSFQCHPSQIKSIKVNRHPLWMKPIPFKFISVTIDELGAEHTFNITPSFGQTDTVWDCNRMTETWVKRLEKARRMSLAEAKLLVEPCPELSTVSDTEDGHDFRQTG